MKQLAWYTFVVLIALATLALFWQFRLALVLFLLSLVTAAAFRPVIDRLTEWHVPRVLAILLTYLGGVGIVGLLVFLASVPFVRELQDMTDQFAITYNWVRTTGENGTQFQKALAERLPPIDALYKGITRDRGTALARNVLGVASGVLDTISNLVIILILSIYWSADRFHFERLWLSMLPAGGRSQAREIWRDIERGVGSYIRSELVQSLLAAVLLYLFYRGLGSRYPTILAIVSALFWLIPWLGAVLAVVPAFLVGLGSGLVLAVLAALITLLTLGFLEIVVEPRFFNRRRYSSLFIVLMVIAMSDAFGLLGLFFAPPLAAAIQIFFSHILTQPASEPLPEPDTRFAHLREQIAQVEQMAQKVREESPHVVSLLERLEKLVDKAEEDILVEPTRQKRKSTA